MNEPIFTGTWGNCHIQGIAVDKENGFIYYSFTTKLIKAKLSGEIIGTVDGLYGWHFPYGSTGLFSYGNGEWLISHNETTPEGQCSYIHHYKWNGTDPFRCLT